MAAGAIRAIGLVLLLPLAGCGITAIRPYESKWAAEIEDSGLSALTVRVSGDPRDVEFATEVLRKSGVFRDVTVGLDTGGDLDMLVKDTRHSIRCGNPQMCTWLSLGLVPSGNVFRSRLELRFSSAGSSTPLAIDSEIMAETRHGLWALPLRASRHWNKPRWEGDAANLAAKLREDLLAHESELLALSGAALE